MKKSVLGRGLAALIPEGERIFSEHFTDSADAPSVLPIHEIHPNPLQPRKFFNDEKLDELVESIKEHGIVQPVIVSRRNGGFQLVVGERRWRAAQKAGLHEIPAIVREYTPLQQMEVALVENIQREDLNPIEEASAYRFLMKEFGLTQEVMAEKIGRSRPAVANTLRLLALPTQLQQDVASGLVSEGHARAVLGVENEPQQIRVWQLIKDRQLSVRQTEDVVRRIRNGVMSPKKDHQRAPHIVAIEEDLQRTLGARVKIVQSSRQSGRIEVSYTNGEELERLLELLATSTHPAPRYRSMSVDLL